MNISPKPDYDNTMRAVINELRREIVELRARPSLTPETSLYLTPDVLPVPKAPEGLTVTQNLPLPSPDGSPVRSRVLLEWDAVTENVDDEPIAIIEYEVWAQGPDAVQFRLTSSRTTTARVDLPALIEYDIFVRAGSIRNLWSEFSDPVTVSGAADLLPMDAPTPPTLSSRLGTVKVEWDGLLVSGPPPDKLRYVFAEISDSETGPFGALGPSFSRNGTVLTGLDAGDEIWVRLIAVDTLSIASAPSAPVSIVVEGISGADIGPEAIEIGNLDETIVEALTGALDPNRIQDGSISTRKLLIANLANLLEDPSFERGETVWTNESSAVTKSTEQPRTGTHSLRLEVGSAPYVASVHSDPIGVIGGRSYLLAGWVAALSDGIDGGVVFSIEYGADDTTSDGVDEVTVSQEEPTDEYAAVAGSWEAPPTAAWARVRVEVADDSGSGVYVVDDMAMILRADGELIVDGAITATKIAAGAIEAEALAADSVSANAIQSGAITAGKIAADAITANEIAAGAITADKIEAGEIQVYHVSATFGEELDLSSNEAVNIIVGQIGEVSDRVDENGNIIESLTTYYRFGPSGATIESPNSNYSLSLTSDGIAINEAGLEVSRWDAGQLIVNSFVGEEVVLGNHKLEKYTVGTVVKAL